MRIRIRTGPEGEVVLPAGEAEVLGLVGGGEGQLISARGAFGLLLPSRGDEPAAWFAGSLAALTVPEVVQFIFTSLKTGVLLLAFGEERGGATPEPERLRRMSIYFRDGQIVFASSSARADRLGQVLRRAGLVPAAQLERCGHLVRSGRPLGQVLVDEGVLSAGQLYEGLSLQVKEILLNAFVETKGTFAFLEGAADERNAVKLPQRTRDLLLEGMRRVDEAEALARELKGWNGVFEHAGEPRRPLTPEEADLFAAADGRRDLSQLAHEASLGQLQALQAAAALVRDGILAPAPPPALPREEPLAEEERPTVRLTGVFDIYRRIFGRVHEGISAVQADAPARLNSYFDRLPARNRAVFDGVRFGPDGHIEVSRVLDNVVTAGQFKGAAARARALEALEDLLAFALFEVKNCLPRSQADALLREVGHMQMGKA
ncbi:MAG TPA: DUF4388 domain-containing protein [Anaeromyxobacter sp.]|nr:DUF4388 domain-containing protein [Anaeromyxobacter sp.]